MSAARSFFTYRTAIENSAATNQSREASSPRAALPKCDPTYSRWKRAIAVSLLAGKDTCLDSDAAGAHWHAVQPGWRSRNSVQETPTRRHASKTWSGASGQSTEDLRSRFCAGWREHLTLVTPEAVVRWHRQGWRLFWRWKSRSRAGRPHLRPEVRDLIATMSRDNRLWATERIKGELLKLGIAVSNRSIRRFRWRGQGRAPNQT